jgi:hypothetical protein
MAAVVAAGLVCEHQRRQKDLGYTEANDQHIKASLFTISPNPACDTFCGEHYPSGRRLNRSATDDHTVASDYVIAQRRPAMLVCTKLPSCVCSRPARPSKPLRTNFTNHGFVLRFLGVVHVVDRLLSRDHGVIRGDDHGGGAGLGPPSGISVQFSTGPI